MNKILAERVEMVPNSSTSVNLAELNKNIAEQQGVSIADPALKGPDGQTVPDQTPPTVDASAMYTENPVATDGEVLTDEQLAASIPKGR